MSQPHPNEHHTTSSPPWVPTEENQQVSGGLPWHADRDPDSRGGRRRRRHVPTTGWQHVAYRLTGGLWNPGISHKQQQHLDMLSTIDTPVSNHRIAVVGLKGGVGKTTNTVALGTVYAQQRRDQAIAIDANPDRGTLADRVGIEHNLTVKDLLNELDTIRGTNDLRRYTNQAPSRLEVIASERDPAKARAFLPEQYQTVLQVVQTFRQIVLTDTGTDLTNPVFPAILNLTDTLVVAASTERGGADLAWETLDRFDELGHTALVKGAVVAITRTQDGRQVDVGTLADAFRERCRDVVVIPHDTHLAAGRAFDWSELSKPTQQAHITLASAVADDFAHSTPW